MSTLAILLITAASAGAGLAVYAAARTRAQGQKGSRPPHRHRERAIGEPGRTARFACVEIKLAPDPCPAAQMLAGEVILAADAPALPLQDCDRHCLCAFVKRTDRRQERRRWSDEGITAMLYGGKERRRRKDRRRP